VSSNEVRMHRQGSLVLDRYVAEIQRRLDVTPTAKVLVALGGWDYAFSAPGDPGICFESEFCLRAWTEGYRVGYSSVPLKGPAGHYAMDGGTTIFAGADRERNRLTNSWRIFERYKSHSAEIDALVEQANAERSQP